MPPTPDASSPRAAARLRPGRLALLASLLLTASIAAVLAPAPTTAQSDGDDAGVEHVMVHEAVTPELEVVPTDDAPIGGLSAAELDDMEAHAAHEPERQLASGTDLEPFVMVGVGFEGGGHESTLVRAEHPDGTWSEWVSLEVGGHEGEDEVEQAADGAHHAPTSEPVWVEEAVGYEVDLPAGATDVQVHLVREGDAEVELAEPGPEAASEVAGAGGVSASAIGPAAGQPWINPRSAWGAAPCNGTPDLASSITFGVVHHTVNSNGYAASQVPSLIRGIQSYHQGANGWSDIGYNFVVDRWGTIWEGRQGSIAGPVIGAHAANANTGSVGAAVLGDFTGAVPAESVVNALQQLIGWKLALYGVAPSAGNVLGHRQAGTTQTACPGQGLFNRVPDIRYGALLYYNVISDPCYGSSAEPFCDVQPGHPFEDDILWVHDQGIADGYADGTFRPGAPVSRQAMSAFLYRLAGLPTFDPPPTPSFTDVGTNHQFRREIEWLASEGVTTGYDDGRFLPLASISRQAMAAFMYRFAESPEFEPPATPEFSDVGVGRPFYLEIHWLADAGISEGYDDGTFRPDADVSRQAMAAFLHRLDGLVT